MCVVSSEGAEGKEKGGEGWGEERVVKEKPGVKSGRVFLLLKRHEVTGLCNL